MYCSRFGLPWVSILNDFQTGIVYYIIVLGIAIIETVISTSVSAKFTSQLSAVSTPFFNILPNMLVSRLVLNIKTYSHEPESAPTLQNPVSTVVFARNRILGNIGAPLESRSFGWTDEDDEEQELADARSYEPTSDTAGGVMTLVPVIYGDADREVIEMMPVERAV